jgi:predicted dehydrogenase
MSIKVAVIGCGAIANSAHIPAYLANKDVEIKYFCDIRRERAEAAVSKYGCGIAIEDYHQILKDPELEAVSVCTPNNTHSTISIDFLKNGKHVLCEKPAAHNFSEVLKMQQAQHETGKILNIGVVNRFNSAVNTIKDMINSGELGEIYHVYISFRSHRAIPGLGKDFTNKSISGGGALIDWGVHFIDLVMYCCSDPEPLTVSGNVFCKLGKNMREYVYEDMWAGPPDYNGVYDVDDSVAAFIRTAGPAITLHGAWAQNIGHNEMHIDFMGDKAGIRLQYGSDFELFGTKDGKLISIKPEFEDSNHYENEINAFIRCIKTREKLPSHIDAIIPTAKILQAIYDSSDAGKEIVL